MGELYAHLLGREHTVVWLRDGYEAMERIDAGRPDLIMLDIMLPWVSGAQLLHELATYRDTATIPVILFSAAIPDTLDEETLRAYGVVAALDKTIVKPSQVLQAVKGALRSTHAEL